MKCARCHHENRPGAKFCEECATPLARACANCGGQLSPTARFCPECAHPAGQSAAARFAAPEAYTPKYLAERILTSKSALEGERKQVTVLFADLKGSMELLADRDPEEARKILDPVLERMMGAVHRYEGTVNQVMGDGIMALFGAPLAHEDHAVRACYAALRMQHVVGRYSDDLRRAQGVEVQIRVGLNSGEVVVRSIGSDLCMDYTAVGQTTHLAARMEQFATPGTVRLTGETLRLAEGYVEVRSLGPIPVKGLLDPIEIFELTGAGQARTRLQAAALRGFTRFVGRGTEVEQLRRVLSQAGAGHGQVVAIMGEAGVGKSRLTYEFTHSPRSQEWLVLETASASYGKATTYFPVIELLRSYFGIEPRDDERRIREKVMGKLLSLDRALEPTLPAFLSLLDVPVGNAEWTKLDPSQRRRQTLDALKRLLLRESQVQPLLLVVEDLHWIDSETQAWLDLLVESLPTARLLLLVNYRPEYGHGWGSKTYYQQVRLDALPTASAEELLKGLLGTGSGLAELRRLLMEHTQGNPLFLEESVRALAETGALGGERGAYRLARPIQSLQLPATAQAILAARVDRLAPGDKRLLQAAAVIGKDVPFSLLEAIAEESEERLHEGLARLQAAEFLYEARLFPELEYTFKHALTHEVAYAGLLQGRRRTLHARILEAMETLYTDRLDEHVERLAHHAVRGDVQEKAVLYLRQAGNKAGVRSALRDARARYEQALGVLQALPVNQSTLEQGFEIRLELRTVLTQLAELRAALERLREAETLSERLNDDHRRARVCSVLMTLHTLLGELDEAVATGTRALEMAGRLGDLRLRILTTSYLAQAQYYRGEYQRVVELATDALAVLPADWIYEHFGMVAPASVYARSWLVISLAELGTFGEAAEHAAEAISLAEPTHHAYTIGLAHRAAGTLHLLEGDWATARSLLEHGIAVLRAGNVSLSLPHTLVGVAWALAQLGAASEALNRLRDGEQALADHARAGMRRAWDDYVVGRTWLLLDRPDEARAVGQRAVELLPSQPAGAAHALHLLGDIEAHSDPPDAECAETYYRKALALAEPRGMRPLVAHCHLGLGKLARRAGKHQQARQHLTTATTMYREMGMRFWLEQAEMATAEPA
jgi:class 3 adenylate cyclase/tetratricopeptide (TPR) repeat protein